MAVEHMVWIKFNEDVTNDRINEHVTGLKNLEQTIPVVNAIRIGRNFTHRADGYTHGMIVTLTERDALPLYLDHPDHVEVATALKQDAQILAMDIEV